MADSLLKLFHNYDIYELVLYYLRDSRYNRVIKQFSKKVKKKRKIIEHTKLNYPHYHPGRFFLNENNKSELYKIDNLFQTKYYIFGILLSHNLKHKFLQRYSYYGRMIYSYGLSLCLLSTHDCYIFTKRMERICYRNDLIDEYQNKSTSTIDYQYENLEQISKNTPNLIKENFHKPNNHMGRFLYNLESYSMNDKVLKLDTIIEHYLNLF